MQKHTADIQTRFKPNAEVQRIILVMLNMAQMTQNQALEDIRAACVLQNACAMTTSCLANTRYLLELIKLILEESYHSIILVGFAHTVCFATKLFYISSDGFQLEPHLAQQDDMHDVRLESCFMPKQWHGLHGAQMPYQNLIAVDNVWPLSSYVAEL